MKVLTVHNFYGSSAPSGENAVYAAEVGLLHRNGHEVVEFTRSSDDLRPSTTLGSLAGMTRGALATPWNPFSYAALRRVLQREKPDVMHVHNTFPLLSPAIFHAASNSSTATVLTLHNYRLGCAAGIPLRDGRPCTECLDRRSVRPALKHGCYRNSRLATLPLATMIGLHRSLGTWRHQVDAFIALTDFQARLMVQAGVPEDRMHVKPHFHEQPPSMVSWSERRRSVVFIGRLSHEKGVDSLLDAWVAWGRHAPVLDIVGDGPELTRLRERVAACDAGERIRFHGQLPFARVQEILGRASLLVLPSISFEGFPMVIREAYACGVAVAASRLGSMACLVEEGVTGALFRPGDSGEIRRTVERLFSNPSLLKAMATRARAVFEARYTAETNHNVLLDIYQSALAQRRILRNRYA